MKLRVFCGLAGAVAILCLPEMAFAQRELHWERVEVDATLDAAGKLRISETQTMVFSGEWNGGERRFNMRPGQKLSFIGLYRADGGGWRALTEDASLDDVDDYAWTDQNILRWRSRRAADPPFANTSITYQLRYELSGILSKDGDEYLLDHDFAFPERDGDINRFALRLTLDRTWQPTSIVHDLYTAESLEPGRGFVVTLPLHYTGAGGPSTLDTSRPPTIVSAVWSLLGMAGVAVVWLFVREQRYGRFAPLSQRVDEAWLREHVFKYDAEVVGAAWDEGIGAPEVVALIARMVSEGKLESEVGGGSSMALRLKVERGTLEGYERSLVEGLFFNGRVTTNTDLVQQHYRNEGFNPATVIRPELEARVEATLPGGTTLRSFQLGGTLWLVGCGLLLIDWYAGNIPPLAVALIAIGSLVVSAIATGVGGRLRENIHWGRGAALACLTPALVTVSGVASFLWYYAGLEIVDVSSVLVLAIVTLALAVTFASTDAMKSRRHRSAVGFRKSLASARAFFIAELGKAQPALRDEWFPWIVAFGLGKRVDAWSARHPVSRPDPRDATAYESSSSSTSSSSDSTPSSQAWTGFSGGRSGGAGGGASWASAAAGMAAGVSPPSSSDSSSGGSSSGSSGSSGGGGGGGW